MNKIPLTIKELKSDTEFNYDVYTKEALISTIVSVRDYFSDLEKENQELRIQAISREAVANEYKEAIDEIKKICNKVPCDWSVCGIEVIHKVIHKIEKVLEEVE